MKVLSVNAGSSTLKFRLYEMPEEKVLMKGTMDRIGLDGSNLSIRIGEEKIQKDIILNDHEDAVNALLKELLEQGVINSLDEIKTVGHRIVHGGNLYSSSVIMNDRVIHEIENISDLAPLHNPANLIGVRAFQKAIPTSIQVGCFDTAFHQTLKEEDYLYPVPYEWYIKYHIRKYGFHGLSHKFITEKMTDILGKIPNLIICHIGNGASISAVKQGKCIDTSMGFTPNAGIMMGTRSGDIDSSIIPYIMNKCDMTVDEVMNNLNKKSGFLGISGVGSDFRDIYAGVVAGNERCKLAFDKYVKTVVNYIAQYYVELGGCDILCFTAGLGENASEARLAIMEKLACLGVKVDLEKNQIRGEEVKLTTDDSSIICYSIPTNEELMIALDTLSLIGE